jgi:hypothetical protein
MAVVANPAAYADFCKQGSKHAGRQLPPSYVAGLLSLGHSTHLVHGIVDPKLGLVWERKVHLCLQG